MPLLRWAAALATTTRTLQEVAAAKLRMSILLTDARRLAILEELASDERDLL